MKWLLALILTFFSSAVAEDKPLANRAVTASECLAWALYDEARGEPLKGARAVLDVVYARMKVRKKDACAIIAERKQFSGYKKHSFYLVTDDMLDRLEAVQRLKPVMKGCEFFHARHVSPPWAASMAPCGAVGGHKFFRQKRKTKGVTK